MQSVQNLLQWMLKYTRSAWYTPLVSFLAGADLFIVVVPTDALAITAAMGRPRQWLPIALSVGVGSTIGCVLLAELSRLYGLPFLEMIGISVGSSHSWLQAKEWILAYGGWAVFFFAVGPLPLQPAIILAALSNLPAYDLALAALIGRCAKYTLLCWLASHAPNKLEKLWGIKGEIKSLKEAQKKSGSIRD